MMPLDGDVLSMFYRKDVLEEFDLKVPRTWVEYNDVASTTHGKLFKNKTLVGSCVGRTKTCAGAYWANLVLSSMTQQMGMSSGSLFDTSNMKPLLGEAFVQTLEWLETQARFGPSDELDECVGINEKDMNEGSCVLTYNWGNSFTVHMNEGSVFQKGEAQMGVAMTPGSTRILDRQTMKLIPCDEELCKDGGTYYPDIGWVNRSPYLAFGGWACAVNNFTTPEKKAIAMEFCAYASSRSQSNKLIVQNASIARPGPDPFRKSHFVNSLWRENGYDDMSVIEYFDVVSKALASKNAVVDIRFPISADIYQVLDEEVYTYLNETLMNNNSDSERTTVRKATSQRLTKKFNTMIQDYNLKATTKSLLLEQYKKLRNVPFVEMNYLGNSIRYYGYAICIFTMLSAVGLAIWTYHNRSTRVIKASQPLFLILICAGIFIFASSIFPLTVDDEVFSKESCDKSCMAMPWLICMGWSILFSALYAKQRRINLVVSNAIAFRSVTISEKDVMGIFLVSVTGNLILMTLWTILDPFEWKRNSISPTENVGFCSVAVREAVSWKVIVTLIGVLNGGLLISANVEAYKARHFDTEYGESVYIGLIMLSFLQVLLVGIPLFFIVHENSIARFFLLSSMIVIMSMSVLCLIFFPKYMRLREVLNSNRGRESTPRARVIGLHKNKNGGLKSNVIKKAENAIQGRMLYEEAWKKRIVDLRHFLKEGGIDAEFYLRKAKILNFENNIVPIESNSTNSSLAGRISQHATFVADSMARNSVADPLFRRSGMTPHLRTSHCGVEAAEVKVEVKSAVKSQSTPPSEEMKTIKSEDDEEMGKDDP